jgi:hypothetical protein
MSRPGLCQAGRGLLLFLTAEAMFMGVMRPAVEDAGAVKAWIMPGGQDCVFAIVFGIQGVGWFAVRPGSCQVSLRICCCLWKLL